MLGNAPFYHQHYKRYVSIFGTLFNDLSIVRKNIAVDGVDKTIKVPLSFMSKDKALERLIQNPDLRATWNNIFPRMSFEAGSPSYAGYRKENTVNFVTKTSNGGLAKMQYSPAPYDINMILTIHVAYFEDGLQIVEQILPFFQPEYTVAAKEIPELNLERDIHIVLNSVTMNDSVMGDFEEGRIIEWDLDFTVKGFFYGPITDRARITRVDANTFFDPDFGEPNIIQTFVGTPPTGPITETLTEIP
jgi:hypothetical protein